MKTCLSVVSDQVQHKPGCSATEDGNRLEMKRDCTLNEMKTKALRDFPRPNLGPNIGPYSQSKNEVFFPNLR